MENLNAENIINEIQSLIKALKDCGGWVKRGNGEGWFNHEILTDALSSIKGLTEENERLNASCTELTQCCTKLETLYKIECKRVDTIKADTIRKMKEGAKKALRSGNAIMDKSIADVIDQVAKEVEDTNAHQMEQTE